MTTESAFQEAAQMEGPGTQFRLMPAASISRGLSLNSILASRGCSPPAFLSDRHSSTTLPVCRATNHGKDQTEAAAVTLRPRSPLAGDLLQSLKGAHACRLCACCAVPFSSQKWSSDHSRCLFRFPLRRALWGVFCDFCFILMEREDCSRDMLLDWLVNVLRIALQAPTALL